MNESRSMVLGKHTFMSIECAPVTQLHSSTFGQASTKRVEGWFLLWVESHVDEGCYMIAEGFMVDTCVVTGDDTGLL